MPTTFAVRFVIATFGGAALGLLIGLIGRYVFDAGWNPFVVMSWGIFVGAIGLSFSLVKPSGATSKPTAEGEDPPVA